MRYVLNYGSAGTLGNPSWVTFEDADTAADLEPKPVAYENPAIPGQYYFDIVWSGIAAPTESILYALEVNGTTLSATVDRPTVDTGASGMLSILAAAGSQDLTQYATALTVMNRAAVQAGMAPAADPFALTASNPDWATMAELLTSLSRDLFRAQPDGWTHLIQSISFTTDGVSQSYALPSGFRGMVDGTMWNRSTRLPAIGPLSMQQRAALQARLVQIVLNVTFQIQGNLLTFPIVPQSGQIVAFDIYTNNWVASAGSPAPDKDRATASTDVLLFDEEMLVAGLKYRFDEQRGFDTAVSKARFDSLLEDAITRNVGAGISSLGGGSRNTFDRMLDGSNVPLGFWPA